MNPTNPKNPTCSRVLVCYLGFWSLVFVCYLEFPPTQLLSEWIPEMLAHILRSFSNPAFYYYTSECCLKQVTIDCKRDGSYPTNTSLPQVVTGTLFTPATRSSSSRAFGSSATFFSSYSTPACERNSFVLLHQGHVGLV
jgi:hypothetical protein